MTKFIFTYNLVAPSVHFPAIGERNYLITCSNIFLHMQIIQIIYINLLGRCSFLHSPCLLLSLFLLLLFLSKTVSRKNVTSNSIHSAGHVCMYYILYLINIHNPVSYLFKHISIKKFLETHIPQ